MNRFEKSIIEKILSSGAIKEGHFFYTPNIHTNFYIDTNILFQNPDYVMEIAQQMAFKFGHLKEVDYVITPNYRGGFLLAHNVADFLNAKVKVFIREQGQIVPRIDPNINGNIIIVDDGINSGTSLSQLLTILGSNSISPKGICVFLNRYYGDLQNDFGIEIEALLNLQEPFKLINIDKEPCDLCSELRYYTDIQNRKKNNFDYNLMNYLQPKCVYNDFY